MTNRYSRSDGFTLIELMIVITILGILVAIGLPQYNEYVLRSKITEAFTHLTSLQQRMEQYYQDNRTYANAAGTGCGITAPTSPTVQYFSFSCTLSNSNQSFTYTATSATLGFTYTVDDAGTRATSAVASGWSGAPTNCWIRNKGGGC